jgi:hypothetical protein
MLTKHTLTHPRRWKVGVLAALLATVSLGTPGLTEVIPPVPIPELASWNANLTTFAKQYCAPLSNGTAPLEDLYFDGARVYYQLASYSGDPSWKLCGKKAAVLYRDSFVRPAPASLPTDWVYSLGLKRDFLSTNDTLSRDAVFLLADQSPVASSAMPEAVTQPYEFSRDVAFALMAYVDSMTLGHPKPPKYDAFVTQALGHIDQWYSQRLWEVPGKFPHYPFMVGLTLQALIQAHSASPDARIPAKIKVALDGLWGSAWLPTAGAFYMDNYSPMAEPIFNLLIAPAYAWYYLETGDVTYRDRADQIFAGGVRQARLIPPWQFNANYMWSFDYVSWREMANTKFSTPPPPPPGPGPTPPPPPPGPTNAAPVCTAANAVPSTLWPPNHRLVPIQIAGVTDPDKDPISFSLSVTQNEPAQGPGRRDLAPDVVVQGGTLYLRAERSGKGTGRVYQIAFEAQDGKGGSCKGLLQVTVPHDRAHDDDDEDEKR